MLDYFVTKRYSLTTHLLASTNHSATYPHVRSIKHHVPHLLTANPVPIFPDTSTAPTSSSLDGQAFL